MYLSRLMLNLRNREVQRDLGNCYESHRTLLRAFDLGDGIESPRKKVGLLYRIEPNPYSDSGGASILIQSEVKPDWEKLPDGYAMSIPGSVSVREVSSAYSGVTEGSVLSFRLRANVVKRNYRSDAKVHERAITDEKDQLDWLRRKASDCGFSLVPVTGNPDILNVSVTQEQGIRFAHPKNSERKTPSMSVSSVMFDGRLQVVDLDRFLSALRNGIGRGKAFGFGLLSLAR